LYYYYYYYSYDDTNEDFASLQRIDGATGC